MCEMLAVPAHVLPAPFVNATLFVEDELFVFDHVSPSVGKIDVAPVQPAWHPLFPGTLLNCTFGIASVAFIASDCPVVAGYAVNVQPLFAPLPP
jgi:hypothetical protein